MSGIGPVQGCPHHVTPPATKAEPDPGKVAGASGGGAGGTDMADLISQLQDSMSALTSTLAGAESVGGGGGDSDSDVAGAAGSGGGADAADDAERFISSSQGGVILDADGEPAGSVPPGSFIDTTNGRIYGPDAEALEIPEGSTVDFFDLPDVATLVTGGGGAPGKGETPAKDEAPGKVAGASGGGEAPAKGEAPGKDEASATADGDGTDVAGASGGGATTAADAPAKKDAPGKVAGASGGGGAADHHANGVHGKHDCAAGVKQLGKMPTLEAALESLMMVLEQLAAAVQAMVDPETEVGGESGGGGDVGQDPVQEAPGKVAGDSGDGDPAQKGEDTPGQVAGESGDGEGDPVQQGGGSPGQVAGDSGDPAQDDPGQGDPGQGDLAQGDPAQGDPAQDGDDTTQVGGDEGTGAKPDEGTDTDDGDSTQQSPPEPAATT